MSVLSKLIEQAKNPSGVIGSFMLKMMNSAHHEMNKWALQMISLDKDAVMLDVGCGGGKTLQLLSKINTYGKIYGIDYSEQAVKDSIKANKFDIDMGKMHIQQASVTNLPFVANYFDVITAFQTHYFWAELENSVAEAFRVIKQQGSFLIIAELYKINYHMKAYKTQEDMEELFYNVGFNTVNYYVSPNQKWICVKGIK